jgi:hypothetical protein
MASPTGREVVVDAESDSSTLTHPLNNIWEDNMVTKIVEEGGLQVWQCNWCKAVFKHWNVTKALCHLLQMTGGNVKPCSSRKIDDEHKMAYKFLFSKNDGNKKRKSLVNEEKSQASSTHLNQAASALQSSKYHKLNPVEDPNVVVNRSVASASASSTSKSSNRVFHQTTFGDEHAHAGSEAKLTMAIADLIHSCGLPFSLASREKFRKVLCLARTSSTKYQPPSRNYVGGELLTVNYDVYMKRIQESLLNEADVYGLSYFGDGATVKKMPLINILASGVHDPAAILEIVDCTSHLEGGGKKDAEYISNLFLPYLDMFEGLQKDTTDLVIFDGASHVQKAGRILQARYPRISVIHGAEHVVSLFYQDLFRLEEFSVLKKVNRMLYKTFGGTMHIPHAVFQKHCKDHNGGKNIGLIRASDTRMGGHVISLLRTLRLKAALISTISSAEFIQAKCKVRHRGRHIWHLPSDSIISPGY